MLTMTRQELIELYEERGEPVPRMVLESPPNQLFNWGFDSMRGVQVPLHRVGDPVPQAGNWELRTLPLVIGESQ